jgi:hypothetical protein
MASPIAVVNDQVPRAQFTGDGLTTAWSVSWPVRSLADLLVTFGEADEPDIAYTVVPIDDDGGFTIRFDTPPLAGTLMTLVRQEAFERQAGYGQEKSFDADTVDAEFADGVMRDQELRMRLGRTVRLPDSDPASDMAVPGLLERSGKFAFWDADGVLRGVDNPSTTDFDPDTYPDASPFEPDDRFAIKQGSGLSSRITRGTLGALVAYASAAAGLPVVTSADLGLSWTGIDMATLLQQGIDDLAATGGGSVWLQPPVQGGSLGINGKVRVHGGVNLLGPTVFALGPLGGLSIQGAVAGDAIADGLRLAADVTAGAGSRDVPIDTSVLGGGAISTFLAVGDRVTLVGKLDSAATPLEWQEAKVTAVGSGSVTIDRDLAYNFKAIYPTGDYETGWGTANRTLIRKQVTAALTVGVGTLGALRLTVASADVVKLSVGDWVLAQDDKKAGDVAGTSTALIHRSLVQIRDITGTAVTVDRWLEHALELAYGARLTLVDVESGTIEGPVLTFTAPADLTVEPVRTCEIAYCVGAAIFDPAVPNRDPYGSVSDALRMKLSADCGVFSGRVSYPKYVGAGQGYGFIFDWCTDCVVADLDARGCRHSVVFSGSSRCHADRLVSVDCKLSDLEFHGAGEQRCWAQDPTIVGGYGTASTSRAAIAFGNSFHLAGSYNCHVRGGTVSHYKAPQTVPGTPDFTVFGIVFEPGVKGCRVERTKFVDVDQLFQILDNPAQPSFVAEDCSLDEVELETCLGYIGWLEGNHYTATSPGAGTYRIKDFRLRNLAAKGVGKLFRFTRIDGLQVTGLKLDGVTIDATEPYLFRGNDVERMVVTRCDVTGVSKGPQLTSCPSAQIDRNVFRGLTGLVVLEDAGGNDATVWAWNSAPGTTTQLGGALTSKIVYLPRTPDSINIADSGIRLIAPPSAKGVIYVWSLSGEFLRVAYQIDVNPALVVLQDYDANVDAVADTATVGHGTAAKLTLIADRVGAQLALVNKRGGNRGVFWAFPGEV